MRRYLSLLLFIGLAWGQCDSNNDGYLNGFDILNGVDCILSGCLDNTQCDFNSDGFIDVFDICLIVDCISSNCYLDTYNYFDNSHNLKHSFLWLDYYAIPVANGLPLNGVDFGGNAFPFWYDAAVAIADFNGDGFEDILHSKTGSDLVTEEYPLELFINDGLNEIFILDSTLIPSNAQNTTAREASIGDFNNDGKPDVFYVDHGIHDGPGAYPSTLLSNSYGYSFNKLDDLFEPDFYHNIASGDLNNDGYLDVIIFGGGGGYNGVFTLINSGSADFTLDTVFFEQASISNMWSHTLYDINSDENLDLIVAGSFDDPPFGSGDWNGALIGIYWGNGEYFSDDNITAVALGTRDEFIGDIAIADINGDGKEEIIGRYADDGTSEKIMVYEHDDNYNYLDVTDSLIENNSNTTGRSMVWIRAQDIDNDGFMDVFNSDKGNSNIGNTQRWEWNGNILERQ